MYHYLGQVWHQPDRGKMAISEFGIVCDRHGESGLSEAEQWSVDSTFMLKKATACLAVTGSMVKEGFLKLDFLY